MKKPLAVLLILFCSIGVHAQFNERYTALFFEPGSSFEAKQYAVNSLELSPDDVSFFYGQPIAFINSSTVNLNTLLSMPEVRFASPVFVSERGAMGAYNGNIYAVQKDNISEKELSALADQNGIEYIGRNEFLNQIVHFRISGSVDFLLESQSRMVESDLFSLAVPGVLFSVEDCSVNDTHYNRQWSLKNVGSPIQGNGTPGADIDVELAWEITTGSSDIKIAIMDSGVDFLHADLSSKMLPGYDAMGTETEGYPTPNFPGDGHGTACAGIAAAETNNQLGIAGVCPNCSIVPIKIFAYQNIFGNVIPFSDVESFINGISWQWQVADVDISSNSWGLTDEFLSFFPGQDLLANIAIDEAVENGRGGLGLSMFFSSGNTGDVDDQPIWPSRNNNTIAVNATSMCDERKSFDSCDNENWEGNWGSGLDVSAPGVRISTTDMTGSNGYNGSDYTHSFNGTSAACPIVAGIAGLVLSEQPNLTRLELEGAIKRGCEKVGGYDYSTFTENGSWSPETGHGRVNAHLALIEALPANINRHNTISPIIRSLNCSFEIELPGMGMANWQLFGIDGKIIRSGASENIIHIATHSFSAGVYVLSIHTQTASTTIKLPIVGRTR
jgi:subtilisin family serine protease